MEKPAGTETAQRITTALLRYGQHRLVDVLGVSKAEVSRKLATSNGWTIEQLAAAMDAAGIRVVVGDQVAVDRETWDALRVLARHGLTTN